MQQQSVNRTRLSHHLLTSEFESEGKLTVSMKFLMTGRLTVLGILCSTLLWVCVGASGFSVPHEAI